MHSRPKERERKQSVSDTDQALRWEEERVVDKLEKHCPWLMSGTHEAHHSACMSLRCYDSKAEEDHKIMEGKLVKGYFQLWTQSIKNKPMSSSEQVL